MVAAEVSDLLPPNGFRITEEIADQETAPEVVIIIIGTIITIITITIDMVVLKKTNIRIAENARSIRPMNSKFVVVVNHREMTTRPIGKTIIIAVVITKIENRRRRPDTVIGSSSSIGKEDRTIVTRIILTTDVVEEMAAIDIKNRRNIMEIIDTTIRRRLIIVTSTAVKDLLLIKTITVVGCLENFRRQITETIDPPLFQFNIYH